MIFFTTVSTTGKFARENGELIKRFLKGLGNGIGFFKGEQKRSMEILSSTLPKERGGGDMKLVEHIYRGLTKILTENLYPTMDAIANVYAEDADTIQVVAMDENGEFSFGSLPIDHKYSIKLGGDSTLTAEGGLKLEMMATKDEVVSNVEVDDTGDFEFRPLSYVEDVSTAYMMKENDGLLIVIN